jgi:hypothetical protein
MNMTSCGAGTPPARQAVEVYARAIHNPSRLYHALPPGQTPGAANARLLAALRRSSAFRTVPASWPGSLASHQP